MIRLLFTKDMNLVWVANLGIMVSYTTSNVLLPLYIQRAGYQEGLNGFIIGTAALGMLVSLLLMGRLIDRGDSRRFLSIGAFLWVITSTLLLLSPSVTLLTAVRFLQGVGFAIFYTATIVYATRSVPGELRGTVVGLNEAVGAVSISLTPFLALAAAETIGYAATFTAAGGLAFIVSLIPFFLSTRPRHDPLLPSDGKSEPFRLLSPRAVLPGAVAAALFFSASAYVSLSPVIAEQLGVQSISLYLGIRAFCTVPTRLASGMIYERKGGWWTVVPGFAAAGLAMVLLPFVRQPGWLYLVPVLLGLGMGLASPAITSWMLKRSDPGEYGVSFNTLALMSELSGFFGTWMVGVLLQMGILPGIPLAAMLAAGLALYLISSKQPAGALRLWRAWRETG